MKSQMYTGVTEDYFSVLNDAPLTWPSDEIDCAVSRATAVIALVMLLLDNDKARPRDSVLSDAIWSAVGSVTLISKLAAHYNHEAVHAAARLADSGFSAVIMFLAEEGQPADYILSDCLDMASMQLVKIKQLSDQEHYGKPANGA